MTHVIFIDPVLEMVLHSVHIHDKASRTQADNYRKKEEAARNYPLERVLIREKLITIMDLKDEIPIPVESLAGRTKC
jgi:hypothetical protein